MIVPTVIIGGMDPTKSMEPFKDLKSYRREETPMKPVIYLAGSIRDSVSEDIEWRERAVEALRRYATVLNPLAGKRYNPETGAWTLYDGEVPDAKYIVQADFWAVDRSDIILFDFRSLGVNGYLSLGTMTEFGRSTARSVLRLGIIEPGFIGHENKRHFPGLHPFIEQNCAKMFPGPDAAVEFARSYVASVTRSPQYRWD